MTRLAQLDATPHARYALELVSSDFDRAENLSLRDGQML